jgi:RNA polymerase sigma-70 factor (ECF subfamily)
MAPLAAAYLRALPTGEAPAHPDLAGLEAALLTLCARGRGAHPGLSLDDAVFVRHLARCGASLAAGGASTCAEDLFLACAALTDAPGAVNALRAGHRQGIAGYLRAIEKLETTVEEVEQRLWELLLVGGAGGPPKLGSYSGRGSLAGFIGILAQRIALDGGRQRGAEARAVAKMAAEVNAVAGDAELAFIKLRYKDGLEQAIRDALGLLDDRERMILRMHTIDGVTLDRIAKVYGVTQPTISRWLAEARARVFAGTRRLLRERLRVSEAEFDSIADLVVSQIDVSVSRILRPAT